MSEAEFIRASDMLTVNLFTTAMSTDKDSSSTEQLLRLVRDALTHLYDYTQLERHHLAERLINASPPSRLGHGQQTRAQLTRRVLLDAIEELNPGDNVPMRALERRAHAILFGLYVEGKDAEAVGDSLGIGGRQLRRDRAAATEALTNLIYDRYLAGSETESEQGADQPVRKAESKAESLRSESARLAQQRERIHLDGLIQKLLPLLGGLATQSNTDLQAALAPDLPTLVINETLLRQIILSLTSGILTRWSPGRVTFVSRWSESVAGIGLRLDFESRSGEKGQVVPGGSDWERLIEEDTSLETLATALDGRLLFEEEGPDCCTLWLLLPHGETGLNVLVVDDTHDLFELFRRYVASGTQSTPYCLNHADSVDQALAQIDATPPDAVLLDLMMPNRDGWDLLQALRTDPATRSIPVIVCSVLHEPELAFSLGAQHYLKKPVGSADLLGALEAVRQQTWAAAAHRGSPGDSAGSHWS